MPKAKEAFRNIGEVADELGVKKHVLRFWEQKFPQLRPMKRGGGRRLYRPSDVALLKGIRDLLHTERYTIPGVQKILREHGVEEVKRAALGERKAASAARPPSGKQAPLLLSAEKVQALQSIAGDLADCHALLSATASARPGEQQKRSGAGQPAA